MLCRRCGTHLRCTRHSQIPCRDWHIGLHIRIAGAAVTVDIARLQYRIDGIACSIRPAIAAACSEDVVKAIAMGREPCLASKLSGSI